MIDKPRHRYWLLGLGGILITCTLAGRLRADWSQWRGPNFNGSSPATNLPVNWTKTEDVVWATPLPGKSGATPVIWQNSIFLPSPDPSHQLLLLCLNADDGKVRWQRKVGSGNLVQAKNNLATPSAVTDGTRVISLMGTGDLAAFGFDGRELWRRNLAAEFGGLSFLFLYGSSPLLYEGRLYLQVIQSNPPTYAHAKDDKPARESFILCLDPATGKTLWRQVRVTDAREEAMECYTTPMPCARDGGTDLVIAGADCVTGHDPLSGIERWRFPGLNLKKILGGRIVPSATAGAGMVFVCGPKREMLVGLKIEGQGLWGEKNIAWKTTDHVPDVCTPLFYQGKLFVLDGDRQVLTCYRPESGAKVWQGKLGVREVFAASPTGADGRIYCLSEEGTLVVLSAGDAFEVLSTTAVGEGPCLSSIAVANNRLYVRTSKTLYCIGKK
jgi:outer membrane protein assembly factor BamB